MPARIVAVADVFDALTHGRPYASPWSVERALDEIRAKRGTQFDPDLVDAFVHMIINLRRDKEDLDAHLVKAVQNSPFVLARQKIRQLLATEVGDRGHMAH